MKKPAAWGPTVNGFFFVLNPLAFSGPLPFEIIPGLFLRKPDATELRMIQQRLDGLCSIPNWPPSLHLGYNADWVPSPGSGGKDTKMLHRLPTSSHRYWVLAGEFKRPIQFSGGAEFANLRCSANLPKNDLDFGFGFLEMPDPYGWGFVVPDNATFTYLMHHNMANPPLAITETDLAELKRIYSAIAAAEKSDPAVFRLAHQFASTKSLPRNSDLQIVGYFSILEALGTHIPKIHEIDSLTHQISTKMPLLSRKFERALDYACFGKSEPAKIWKKLYSFRSCVAHGNVADFKKDFAILKDMPTALSFVKEAVKLTLLYALKDPVFLADLREC